jgi:arylsulfatase A-like enzyme
MAYLTGRAVQFIVEHSEQQPDSPLFLYLAYQAMHSPTQAPEHYMDPFNATIPDHHRRTVAAMVAAMDEGVGNVTAALKRVGMLEKSLIIFSTDNGGPAYSDGNAASNFPLRGEKNTLWEGGVRGVGLVSGFGLHKSLVGVVSRQMHHAVDWLPTLLSIAVRGVVGPPSKGAVDWRSLLSPTEPPRQLGDGVDNSRLFTDGTCCRPLSL